VRFAQNINGSNTTVIYKGCGHAHVCIERLQADLVWTSLLILNAFFFPYMLILCVMCDTAVLEFVDEEPCGVGQPTVSLTAGAAATLSSCQPSHSPHWFIVSLYRRQ